MAPYIAIPTTKQNIGILFANSSGSSRHSMLVRSFFQKECSENCYGVTKAIHITDFMPHDLGKGKRRICLESQNNFI